MLHLSVCSTCVCVYAHNNNILLALSFCSCMWCVHILLCTSIYGIVNPTTLYFLRCQVKIRLADQTQVCVSLFPNHSEQCYEQTGLCLPHSATHISDSVPSLSTPFIHPCWIRASFSLSRHLFGRFLLIGPIRYTHCCFIFTACLYNKINSV